MFSHDRLNRLGRLVGVVEGYSADIMMKNVRLDDAVEELATDETKFAVDGCGCAAGERPGLGRVMGKGRIRVLEECDRH